MGNHIQPGRSTWTREAYAARRPLLLARQAARRAIADHFLARGFMEVETPALQVSPGLEPQLQAFATTLEAPDGTTAPLYLHTSPEFAMKKVLAAGEALIFQFARVFRNGERARTHHPEFTMLEWYRAGGSMNDLVDDVVAILRLAAQAAGRATLSWLGRTCRLDQGVERLSVAEAFARHAGLDLGVALADPSRFSAMARGIGVRIADDDGFDAIFFKVFLERIEPQLGTPRPTILCDYPIHMAALARPKPDAPNLAERFEVYVAGLELANAFGELTDRAEQERRFIRDQAEATALRGHAYPIDPDFLDAVASMPDAVGIALGFDRLMMLATEAKRIEDVLWLPVA